MKRPEASEVDSGDEFPAISESKLFYCFLEHWVIEICDLETIQQNLLVTKVFNLFNIRNIHTKKMASAVFIEQLISGINQQLSVKHLICFHKCLPENYSFQQNFCHVCDRLKTSTFYYHFV